MMRIGPQRRLMLSIYGVGEDSWEALGQQGDLLKEINPERTDAEAEGPILWPPDAKNWLIGKALDAGKDWWREEKETSEDEMVGWHHQLNGREFEQTPGDSRGQGSLACCSPGGWKKSDTTEWRQQQHGKSRNFLSINDFNLKKLNLEENLSFRSCNLCWKQAGIQ